ncbi:hypothetical protein GCM10027443_13950 [Pontibacter brevis]
MEVCKPRILISIDWYLPGYKAGGPIQSCANLIAHLKGHYDFWVITRDTDYCSDLPYANIESDAWNHTEEGVQVYYFSSSAMSALKVHKLLKSVKPDLLYINGVYSFYFSIVPLLSAKLLQLNPVMIAGRGMFAAGSVNVKAGKKRLFYQLAKSLGLYQRVIFHATNQEEKEDIIKLLGDRHEIRVAPNLPKLTVHAASATRSKKYDELRLVSIARVSPEKNTKYALEVLQAYRGEGFIVLDIFGPIYNELYWKECEAVIAAMPATVNVNYFGSIPNHEVQATLMNYHALFMPTRGENFGHTILESLTAGCPVIISDKTPWRNLKEKGAGYDLALDNKNAFLESIEALLNMDESSYTSLSKSTMQFAQEHRADPLALEANRRLFTL